PVVVGSVEREPVRVAGRHGRLEALEGLPLRIDDDAARAVVLEVLAGRVGAPRAHLVPDEVQPLTATVLHRRPRVPWSGHDSVLRGPIFPALTAAECLVSPLFWHANNSAELVAQNCNKLKLLSYLVRGNLPAIDSARVRLPGGQINRVSR